MLGYFTFIVCGRTTGTVIGTSQGGPGRQKETETENGHSRPEGHVDTCGNSRGPDT